LTTYIKTQETVLISYDYDFWEGALMQRTLKIICNDRANISRICKVYTLMLPWFPQSISFVAS